MIAVDPASGHPLFMPPTLNLYEALQVRVNQHLGITADEPGVEYWPSFGCTGPNGPGRLIYTYCTCDGCL